MVNSFGDERPGRGLDAHLMFSVTWKVSKAKWLEEPHLRWNAGLEKAGEAWRQNLQRSRYGNSPIANIASYQRTGTLANKSNYRIVTEGKEMEFFSVEYTKYLLFGTGIFGPKHTPITPTHAPMLVWRATGNFGFELGGRGGVKRAGKGTVFVARSVRGTIWPGKRDELVQKMVEAFGNGVRSYRGGSV